MMLSSKHYYILLSGLFFSFFFTWAAAFSMFSLWLEQIIGLNGEQRGFNFSVIAITAVCLQPLFGFIQDKLGLKRHLLWFVGIMLFLSGPFYIYIYGPLLKAHLISGIIVGGIFIGITFQTGIGVLESYIERVGRLFDIEYGRLRMWGSFGWAACTLFAGKLFNINPDINYVLASLSAIVFLILLYYIRAESLGNIACHPNESHHVGLKDVVTLFKSSQFWGLIIMTMGLSMYSILDQQFSVYFTSLFATIEIGNAMFGYVYALQIFLEAICLGLAPWFVNRIGAKNALVISGMIMSSRIIAIGLVDGAWWIGGLKLLQAIEVPMMLIAVFKFITLRFPQKLSSTIYLVGYLFIVQVCTIFFAPLVGIGYDTYGYAITYMMMGSFTGMMVLAASMIFKSDYYVA